MVGVGELPAIVTDRQSTTLSAIGGELIKNDWRDIMLAIAVWGFVLLAATVQAAPRSSYQYSPREFHNNLPSAKDDQTGLLKPPRRANSIHNDGKYLPPAAAVEPATNNAPIVTKQFFLVSAPEEADTAPQVKHLIIGRPQTNYRVIFIKAPASENSNLKLSAEFAPQEEKTVIYVLTKKDKEIAVEDIATPAPTKPSKPEVIFVKYKTDEEATAAQKEIQGQYDHIGGTSEFSDEGVAPLTSVVGTLNGMAANGGYDYKRAPHVETSASKDFWRSWRYRY